jgi:hypothetical protein
MNRDLAARVTSTSPVAPRASVGRASRVTDRVTDRVEEGPLGPEVLVPLLLCLADDRVTGMLLVEDGSLRCQIFLRDGLIIDARCGQHVGARALFLTLACLGGRYVFVPGLPADGETVPREAHDSVLRWLRDSLHVAYDET